MAPPNEPENPDSATSDDPRRDAGEGESEESRGRFSRFTRRILDRGEDGRNVWNAMWETSDRARTEMVRLVAREVRNYLDALELKDDLKDLVRSHSLEVTASFRLKPIEPESPHPAAPPPKPSSESPPDDSEPR
jgi:hypothetical protein